MASSKTKNSWINLSIIFLIGFLPFSFALNPKQNIDLSIIRIFIPLVFLSWLIKSLFKKKLLIDSRFRAWLLIFIFLISIISLFWATNSTKALRKILFLGSILPIYWILFSFLKNKLNQKLFLKIVFWTTFISATIGLIQFVSQFIFGLESLINFQSKITPFFLGRNFAKTVLEYNSWLVNLNGKTVFRAIGLFPDPHLFSLFLNIGLPVGFYLFFKEKKSFFLFSSFIILLTSLLTFSRAGYLSLFVAFCFFWLFFLRKKNVWNIALVMILAAFLIIPNPISQRFFSIFDFQEGSITERLDLWKTGVEITKNNLWTGVGIGNLSEEIQPLSNERIPIYAHNLFLDLSSELGFMGGLAIFVVIISPILNFLKNRTKRSFLTALIFIIILIHSMFETPIYSTRLLPLILSFLAL